MSLIYLDFNRTTPLAPSVQEAMEPYWSTHFMLPDQRHSHAQAIGEALEHARECLAGMIGCEAFEAIFTGGGTESNNLAVLGLLADHLSGHILVSELEHESVSKACRSLGTSWIVESFPCGLDGCVDPDAVKSRLREDTKLVCLQAANPVLGTIQPVREVADLCHTRGVLLHCDATQVFGKMPVSVDLLRADTIAVSGHKFYGPKGTGGLYVRRGLKISPITFGEPREMGLRPGAENVPGCIGIGAAANLCGRCCSDASDSLGELRDLLANGLREHIPGDLKVLCEDSPRLPNTLAVRMPVLASRVQLASRQTVIATAQSESPPDEMTRSLRAIGQSDTEIASTIRFSVGWTTSQEQIERAITLISAACDAS